MSNLSTVEERLYGLDVVSGVIEDKRLIFQEPTFREILAVVYASYGTMNKEDAAAIRHLLLTDPEIFSMWRGKGLSNKGS